jgi:hypothetical protein
MVPVSTSIKSAPQFKDSVGHVDNEAGYSHFDFRHDRTL